MTDLCGFPELVGLLSGWREGRADMVAAWGGLNSQQLLIMREDSTDG